ncbi:LysR family transcriptional regulator [Actinokineospora sp. NBRC 105648]|uniref:LysR family transcriptional regulator n=1 Tax=Actinokineospora sp. NBRC 105648 TaxID=3032206 RepID=UPI00249F9C72|nr:LysR family transcriptional regulator [Actinokineospora sp. NBRC 105648]GLZ38030.1 putative transcriptional regulator, LysR family protein [Actinokineospora sp. NBRC 105648]
MDLNLLAALDALLQESSVTGAADRLGTSPAAMSRKLASLRRIVGDQLLVRSGQRMVPTVRALELRTEVRALIERTEVVLTSSGEFDVAGLRRTFTVQVGDLLLAGLATSLVGRVRALAPGVGVVFAPESLEGTPALRQGLVDVEVGVLGHLDPETRAERLTTVPLLAAARADHPLFDGPIDARRFAAAEHVGISRTGKRHGPIDAALEREGLRRDVVVVVPGHTAAMVLARNTDLVCLTTATGDLADAAAALGLRTFPIPLDLPPVEIGMAWHPRHDTDSAHRWFRDHIRATVTAAVRRPG